MVSPDKEKMPPDFASKGPAKDILLDTKQIAEAVVELNILRKNVQIYPIGHDQVQRSLTRTHQILLKTLALNSSLTLGIAKDALMIGEAVLDPDNAVFKEFATAMKHHDIAAVTFNGGVQADELVRFLSVVSKLPEEVNASGGIEAAFSKASLQHIAIRKVDYSQFYLTDEAEAVKTVSKDGPGDPDMIWKDFISHFVADTLSQSDQDLSVGDVENCSPVQLAKALNSGRVGNVTALDTYDRIVSRHLRYTASQKESHGEQGADFNRMNLLLQELSPELRKQFLSVTFNRCEPRGHIPETETFLRGLSENFVVEMLLQASEEGKEISPSLLSLVQKISNIDGIEAGAPLVDTSGIPIQPSHEKLQQLFKREDHETFVVPEYDTLLQKVAETSGADSDAAFPMEEYSETLKSPHLDIQIARVVIAFLETDVGGEEYKDYADQLLSSLPALISSGSFQILLVAYETFSRHQEEKQDVSVRLAAEAALKMIRSPELITKALRVFDRRKIPDDGNGRKFLLSLGAVIVPETVSILAKRENADENAHLYQLLGRFRKETISEVKKRLRDTRFSVVKNMLLLLQALKAKEAKGLLQPFLDHPDAIIRMQALKALLDFDDPGAVPHLRREIQSNLTDFASQAIEWAGQYKIREVIPDLLSKMKKIVIFRSDIHTNKKIIVALGKIGDPASIAPMVEMVNGVFTIYRKQLVEIKKTLYKSLAGYPYSAVVDLIRSGYRSRDKDIRAICRGIRKKSEPTADK